MNYDAIIARIAAILGAPAVLASVLAAFLARWARRGAVHLATKSKINFH